MRRRRLKHVAFTLCDMFCGWRLANCIDEVIDFGTGTLVIDVSSSCCMFNGKEIASLSIAGELQIWFQKELLDYNIPPEKLISAELEVQLEINVIKNKKHATKRLMIRMGGENFKQKQYYNWGIDCRSKIITDEAMYEGRVCNFKETSGDYPKTKVTLLSSVS